jgi:predicted GNAT family acetyltransferase
MMSFRLERFKTAAAFLHAAGPYLLRQEALNCLLLGIAAALRDRPGVYTEPPYLAVVRAGDVPVLAALRTPPRAVVLSVPAAPEPEALALIIEDLAAQDTAMRGVIGPKETAEAFARLWARRVPVRMDLLMRERVYELQKVVPARPVPGHMRLAGPGDLDLLREWVTAFSREATPEEEDPVGAADHLIQSRLPAGPSSGLVLWEQDNRCVSLAGWSGPTASGIRVGPVYTPPDQRGRGYASALVAALSQWLLDGGRQRCFLFTDLANPTSNSIYQAIGYRPVGDQDFWGFRAIGD